MSRRQEPHGQGAEGQQADGQESGGRESRGQTAVIRTYQELRGKGQPDRFALEAALTVYFWHHPLAPAAEAGQIVAGWVRASGTGDATFH